MTDADYLADIDMVIHPPARLRLITQLYVVDSADATLLVNQTGLTWGNLATHLKRVALSGPGREAFDSYRATIKAAFDQIAGNGK